MKKTSSQLAGLRIPRTWVWRTQKGLSMTKDLLKSTRSSKRPTRPFMRLAISPAGFCLCTKVPKRGVLAVEMGATAKDLALTVHPHPTLSETIMEAAEAFYGHATHTMVRKKEGKDEREVKDSAHSAPR